MNFTPEQLTKAKAAKSAEELLALAKESGIEMTEEEAKNLFAKLHAEGELADDELGNVSGGCGGDEPEKKEPQEYPAVAGWAPPCDGKHERITVTVLHCPLGAACCGNCRHFKHNEPNKLEIESSTQGVCRREFES